MKSAATGTVVLKNEKSIVTLIAVFALVFSVLMPKNSATAATVFLNAPQDGAGCGISDYGWDRGQQEADDFLLTGPNLSITSVRWWGAYGSSPDPAAADNFIIRFFSDSGGKPADNPFAQISVSTLTRMPTNMTASVFGAHDGGAVYEYVAGLSSSITVNAGTKYYMSIVNNTGSAWGWLEDGPASHWFRYSDTSVWTDSTRCTNLAFELSAVPEPATIVLLGLGTLTLLRKRS